MRYLTYSQILAVGHQGRPAHGSHSITRVVPRVLLAATLACAAGWLHAQTVVPTLDQDGRKGDMARLVQQKAKEKFDTADRDHNGKLSKEETATALPYLTEHFEKYDKDGDGFLSWEEYVGHTRWKKD